MSHQVDGFEACAGEVTLNNTTGADVEDDLVL